MILTEIKPNKNSQKRVRVEVRYSETDFFWNDWRIYETFRDIPRLNDVTTNGHLLIRGQRTPNTFHGGKLV